MIENGWLLHRICLFDIDRFLMRHFHTYIQLHVHFSMYSKIQLAGTRIKQIQTYQIFKAKLFMIFVKCCGYSKL